MNEVEKMYDNANVEMEFAYFECHRGRSSICCPIEEYEKDDECMGCINSSAMEEVYKYPPFTAEKQLELIKWLAIRFNSDYMSYWHNEIKDVWIFRLNDLTEFSSEEPCIYEGRNKDFTEALCNLINDLWQDLTEEERKQIKNILESEVRE